VTAQRITVLRIAHSTNVERIALAAAHKRVAVEWQDVDPADRSAVSALSGQELVPVLKAPDGAVVADSVAILRWLERAVPQPALWPAAGPERAVAEVAVEWFNSVWKEPPNAIDDELASGSPDGDRITALSDRMRSWLPLFEGLLEGREFLLGDALGVLDVCAFPFLKYGTIAPAAGDDETFHHVLHEHLADTRSFPRLAGWIERVDSLPRA
jgi:glutathione S-transferase